MKRYAKIIDESTKQCAVGTGTDTDYYKSIGMTKMDVEEAYDGSWYVKGYAPEKPIPTDDDQKQKREEAYTIEVDPITCHINRLKDNEQTPDIVAQIEELKQERDKKVNEIKKRYPYHS